MCFTFYPMLCTTLFSIKARAQFKLASAIFNSIIRQQHQVTQQQHYGALSLLYLHIYIYIYNTLRLTHIIHLFAFGTVGFGYLGEGQLLGTLHPTRPGPNLFFYIGEEKDPGWGHYSTDPRRQRGPRSLTRHLIEKYLALKIETIGTC